MAVAPAVVYHYTKASTALEFILQDRRMRLSPIIASNDPLEANSHPVGVSGRPGARDQMRTVTDRVLDIVRKPHLIACFARDTPDDQLARHLPAPMYGWQRDRMWAQYADNFRGVCLCLDRAALERNARELETERQVVFGEVTYDLEPPYPTDLDLEAAAAAGVDSRIAEYVGRWARARFLSKRPDWAGEWEYRVASFGGDGSRSASESVFVPITGALQALYVGSRFSDGYLPCVEAVCRREGIKAFQFDPADPGQATVYFDPSARSHGGPWNS